jgi:O-methyltransferase
MVDPNATVMWSDSVDKMIETRHIEDGKWNYGAYEVVRNNMLFGGYPPERIHLVKGKVEDTLAVQANLPNKIALLRLDTDWYESTKIEMDVLFERLQPGGLLAVDDFCHWDGSRKAIQEYFSTNLGLNYTRDDGLKMVPCFHYWKPKE